MGIPPRPKIVPQNHAHIHPPERVGLDPHRTHPERGRYVPGPRRVTAASYNQRGFSQRIGVTEKHHVQFLPAEHPGGCSGSTLSPGAVQHLDRDAAMRGSPRDSGFSARHRVWPQPEAARRDDQQNSSP